MKKPSGTFSKILFEIFTVSIGIILGLIVNDWREDRAKEMRAAKALETIEKELEFNIEGVESRIDYYHSLLSSMHKLASDPAIKQMNQVDEWKGTRPPLLKNSAYQMALNSGVLNDLDVEVTSALSEVYSFQAAFQDFISFASTNAALVDSDDSFYFFYTMMGLFEESADIYLKSYGQLEGQMFN